jgi:hypothetical protein
MLDRAIAALKADQASALKAFNDERCRDAACWRSSLMSYSFATLSKVPRPSRAQVKS